MRTTEHTLDLTLAGTLSATARPRGLMSVVASVWRLMRNRKAIGHLQDLDDRQLLDIGLCRHDLREALTASLFEDACHNLTQASRQRTNTYYRNARLD